MIPAHATRYHGRGFGSRRLSVAAVPAADRRRKADPWKGTFIARKLLWKVPSARDTAQQVSTPAATAESADAVSAHTLFRERHQHSPKLLVIHLHRTKHKNKTKLTQGFVLPDVVDIYGIGQVEHGEVDRDVCAVLGGRGWFDDCTQRHGQPAHQWQAAQQCGCVCGQCNDVWRGP
jgi:hypothetical protein